MRPKSTQPTKISVDDADIRKVIADANVVVSDDRFWAIRGKAVNAYAGLEQALCRIFADLSDTSDAVASIIFFRISSTQVRNAILEKLLHLKHGSKYNLFWNSIVAALRPIDLRRNEIVHWAVVSTMPITVDGFGNPEVTLRPRTFWTTDDNEKLPTIATEDMIAFIRKCGFYSNVINHFSLLVPGVDLPNHVISAETDAAWHDIFQKPLTYPLPKGVQLPPSAKEYDNPPQSSPG